MITTISLFSFFFLFSRYIGYRRKKISRLLRKGVKKNIFSKIRNLVLEKKLLKNKKQAIPYYGVVGSDEPEKIIVLQAGVHGLECFAIESLLELFSKIDENFLKINKVQIHVVPIVNLYGFKKFKRTNKNGVDLVRNSPYKSRHKRMIPFVSGWKTSLIKPLSWLANKSWYFMGEKMEEETNFLFEKFSDLIDNKKEIVFFDFHTGNTSPKTTIWRHELDQRVGVPLHLEKVLKDNDIIFEPIDYGTHGGLYEYLADAHTNHELNAFTVELGVLDNRDYMKEYFFGSIFLPPKGKRKEFLERETQKITEVIKAEIIHRDSRI